MAFKNGKLLFNQAGASPAALSLVQQLKALRGGRPAKHTQNGRAWPDRAPGARLCPMLRGASRRWVPFNGELGPSNTRGLTQISQPAPDEPMAFDVMRCRSA